MCVGLDLVPEKIPLSIGGSTDAERCLTFAKEIVVATADVAGAYKPNASFYEALGPDGFSVMRETIEHIRLIAPDALVIVDAKRADIASTNDGYVKALFDLLGADAVTLHPYLGREALAPFLKRKDKGCFILCRTSNPGASELQDLDVGGEPLYLRLAGMVNTTWNVFSNCGLVAGATYPEELELVRRRAPELPLLIPGIGAQGGDLERSIRAAVHAGKLRAFINSSRAILYASEGDDYADASATAARELDAEIRATLATVLAP